MPEPIYIEIIRSIISDVLDTPASEIDDTSDLFELGLDSILVIQIVARIRKQLNVTLPIKALFVSPSIGGIAYAIELEANQ